MKIDGKIFLITSSLAENVNFEKLDVRMQAIEDPNGFLEWYSEGAIFGKQHASARLAALWSVRDCHLRAVYGARCPAYRLSKPTKISTCVQVAVLLVSTRAFK